jgi:putative hydrolase of the HAD superfamily
MGKVKAITFDFWGTLYHGVSARHLRMRRLVEVLGANGHVFDPEALEVADRAAGNEWDRAWREEYRTLSAGEWLLLMLGHLGVTLPRPDFEALAGYFDEAVLDLDPPLRLIDGADDAVRRLAQSYRLGVISDTGLSIGRTLRRFLERDGLIACFACLSFSDETGVSKPHPDAFLRPLAHLGAQPAEAVHIGDLIRTDVGGAKAVGMRAVRYAGSHDDADHSVEPDATVSTYAEFELLIRTWDSPRDLADFRDPAHS